MSDQSKKANQPKKGPSKKEEAARPMNGKPSGSRGNSSTETTSGGGGNSQAASSQPQPAAIGTWEDQTLNQEPPLLIELPGREQRSCPKETSDQIDKDMKELEDNNQPGNNDKVEGKGKGKNV
ncbi:uncharacterized protein FTJAE_10589 [Fusarium tjaetaba]|uniref:Uncharacterized protein n=1 Tax=Fusarium tjaetaba TaxID=1567544 RepID=A0A8H5VIH3_9HYPO|nr:uncharacterized protein FTJAE_10589 [Fusarium tjaetaba]KAF5623508.1 hypothetical protein FTJAE_10589 [Fusarium tjaetaba]